MSEAPSFSSFPPSFASFPDSPPGSSKVKPTDDDSNVRGREKTERATDSNKEKKRRRDGRHKDRKHKREIEKRTVRLLENEETFDHGSKLSDNNDESTWRLFYSDRRGDMLNIQFGGLHVGDVPKYRLVDGGRSILGLSSAWATRRSSKGVEIEVRGQRKLHGLTDPGSRTLLAAVPTRRLLSSGDVYKYEETDGFLPLPSRRHGSEQPYRSITLPRPDPDSDLPSESEYENEFVDSDEELTLTSHQEKLKSLEQQLSQNPTSIRLWHSLLAQTLSTVPLLSKNATKARAEITLSVLSQAMAADPRNVKSKTLRIMYLKSGENIWEENKVHDEWEDALKVGGIEIWMEWLEWRTRRGKKGVEGVAGDAIRAMSAFGSSVADELAKLRIFWRTAVAFRNAGYVERATAMFQAQAELTFKSPQSLHNNSPESLLEILEEFWESEAPRIGELGAQGWGSWTASGKIHRTVPQSSTVQVAQPDLDPYRQWAMNEACTDCASIMPGRSTDERAELDPFSTVLFSDIRHLLFLLKTSEARNAFRLAWLSFIGLSVPGYFKSLSELHEEDSEVNWDDRWCSTHLHKLSYLNAIFPEALGFQHVKTDAIAGALVGREKEYASGFGPVKNWGYGVLGPVHAVIRRVSEKGKWKENRYSMWQKEDVEGIYEDLVRRMFVQLRLEGDDSGWNNLALAFEATLGLKSALKLSRQLLSAQNSLSLWASHAQLERTRGRLDDARKVYHTVLVASAPSKQVNAAQLWWDWAEMEWLAGMHQEASNIILRSAGIEGKGGVGVLRAKRTLDEASRHSDRWVERVAWVRLRALLELLTTADVEAAVELFDAHSDHEGSVQGESLTVASLLMLYYHSIILQSPMPPALLRERTKRAIGLYPSNSIIFGLFLEGEKGQGVWGRIRTNLGESGGKSKDVARRVEEVWAANWEKGRWTDEIERTRSGLSAAVEHDRTRGSAVIWRVFVEFEIRANDFERAKKLLYRAIAECPLVKDLYLMAFGPLRSVFNSQELITIADTMAERGIRMRQGLEEILEGWTMERVTEQEEEEDNELDEIEENAHQLRRLMPY
ncbi:hypothetical protein AX15_000868 [Amanita polypyramis BW_CC]|nr:hypothetical protein AX15_000868 [Amanita polypyramis BW_CC]